MSKFKATDVLQNMTMDLLGGLRQQYFDIATAIFKWNNLPPEIPIRYPERWLYQNGMCAFTRVNDSDVFVCLPVATESIQKNAYGEPSAWRVVAMGDLAGVMNGKTFDEKNSVLIRNDACYRPSLPYVDVLIKQMVNTELTMRMNLNAQKNPMWIKTSDENALQNKNTFMEFYECQPVFFKDSTAPELEFYNPGIPFIGSEIADIYNIYDQRILSFLGLDNSNIDKKERLVVAEAESKNDKIFSIRTNRLEQRKIACDAINDLFGLGVSVEVNCDLNNNGVSDAMEGDSDDDVPGTLKD